MKRVLLSQFGSQRHAITSEAAVELPRISTFARKSVLVPPKKALDTKSDRTSSVSRGSSKRFSRLNRLRTVHVRSMRTVKIQRLLLAVCRKCPFSLTANGFFDLSSPSSAISTRLVAQWFLRVYQIATVSDCLSRILQSFFIVLFHYNSLVKMMNAMNATLRSKEVPRAAHVRFHNTGMLRFDQDQDEDMSLTVSSFIRVVCFSGCSLSKYHRSFPQSWSRTGPLQARKDQVFQGLSLGSRTAATALFEYLSRRSQ
jgi:hypothetical protein